MTKAQKNELLHLLRHGRRPRSASAALALERRGLVVTERIPALRWRSSYIAATLTDAGRCAAIALAMESPVEAFVSVRTMCPMCLTMVITHDWPECWPITVTCNKCGQEYGAQPKTAGGEGMDKPKNPQLDASGECPCNGFSERGRSREN